MLRRFFEPASASAGWTAGTPESAAAPKTMALSPMGAMALAVACGLTGGYIDLLLMLFKKSFLSDEGYLGSGRDFPWSVPVAHVLLSLCAGAVVAAINALRPGSISLRAAAWLLITVALWGALLRLPLYGAVSLFLGFGLARPISGLVAARRRYARRALFGLIGLLGVLAAISSGRQAFQEWRARTALPAAQRGARNVVLITWDTVGAYDVSLYGYPRETTPNLTRWAERGVKYNLALAPAPWTYPSHSTLFTGQWPYKLNTQWNYSYRAADPTLAEFLTSHGYQSAGFAANTNCCSWETGLDRGFTHFEDYTLTLKTFLARTVPGLWLLEKVVCRGDLYDQKWIRQKSRDAAGINDAFLTWLRRREPDRPFFAFLNYFDAHDPYIPNERYAGRFGIRPRHPWDYVFLSKVWSATREPANLPTMRPRDLALGRDCYNDCIAFLDAQLGRLLGELKQQGLLENTLVIITSDHGEAFGQHGRFGHTSSVYLDEVAVPLVILSPDAPAGHSVDEAVSLRDVPATVVEQLRLADHSPFPGVSLAALWARSPHAERPSPAPALSEVLNADAFNRQRPLKKGAVVMSLLAGGQHYLRSDLGREELFDLHTDPMEQVDRLRAGNCEHDLRRFRRMLLQVLEPGTTEVETSYLAAYRRDLAALVGTSQSHGTADKELAAPRPMITPPSNAAGLSARNAPARR